MDSQGKTGHLCPKNSKCACVYSHTCTCTRDAGEVQNRKASKSEESLCPEDERFATLTLYSTKSEIHQKILIDKFWRKDCDSLSNYFLMTIILF